MKTALMLAPVDSTGTESSGSRKPQNSLTTALQPDERAPDQFRYTPRFLVACSLFFDATDVVNVPCDSATEQPSPLLELGCMVLVAVFPQLRTWGRQPKRWRLVA